MLEKQVVVGPFQCNCRILACGKTGEAVVVDPGDDAESIVKAIHGLKTAQGAPIRVKWLLHTHAHLDHIGGTRGLRQALDAATSGRESSSSRIALHADDEPLYQQLRMQGELFGLSYEDPLPVEHRLQDGEEIRFGELKLSVIHTPGHSPGSISLRLHEDSAAGSTERVLTGDTLFQGSVGRTDLWGADGDLMFRSIRQRLLTLDGDTRVCPGHGPDSTIGIEKLENPFLS